MAEETTKKKKTVWRNIGNTIGEITGSKKKATATTSTENVNTAVKNGLSKDLAAIASLSSDKLVNNQEAAAIEPSYQVNSIYESGNGRLLNFSYNTGGDDDSKRAYFKLGGETNELEKTISSTSSTVMQLKAIFNQLTTGYKAFILTNIQENLQEKQQIMSTVADASIQTFSGAEPQVIALNGLLPFDNSSDSSWFVHFMNMYIYFIRASKLAKHRCFLQVVLPDYQTYKCYPISITCNLDSSSDTLVQFGLTAVVANDWSTKAYGYTAATTTAAALDSLANIQSQKSMQDSTKPTTAKSDNNQNTTDAAAINEKAQEKDTQQKKESGQSNTTKDLADKAKKKNFFQKTGEAINSIAKKAAVTVNTTMQRNSGVYYNDKNQSIGDILQSITKVTSGNGKGRGISSVLANKKW